MILADLASIIVLVAIPAWVSYRIFSNDPDRPKLASWALAVIGGPVMYGLLSLIVFALFSTNLGAGFADVFLALLVSLVSASICAVFVRPKSRPASIASPKEEHLNAQNR